MKSKKYKCNDTCEMKDKCDNSCCYYCSLKETCMNPCDKTPPNCAWVIKT